MAADADTIPGSSDMTTSAIYFAVIVAERAAPCFSTGGNAAEGSISEAIAAVMVSGVAVV